MLSLFENIFTFLFVRKPFYRFFQYLYVAALKGMGYLNYKNMRASGELYVLNLISNAKNPLILDVGAAENEGFLKEIYNRYPDAIVHAFEPNKSSFQILVKNNQRGDVHYYEFGLGEKKAKMKLYDYKASGCTQHASIYKDNINEVQNKKVISRTIDIQTLDSFISSNTFNRPIDFLKIDTEGAELSVLKGARKALSSNKIKYIQFEFNVMNVYSRVFLRDFIQLLPNYDLYKMMPDGLIPLEPYTPWMSEIFCFHNIFAILKDQP